MIGFHGVYNLIGEIKINKITKQIITQLQIQHMLCIMRVFRGETESVFGDQKNVT